MIKATFLGDEERYQQLKRNQKYNIGFRLEGILVFVDIETLKREDIGTFIFNDMQIFLDSWEFSQVKKPNHKMRKLTDFETTRFFTTGEVSELFGVHKNTVVRWAKSGKLKYSHRISPGGPRRFAREECMRLYETMMGGEYE